jgi:hypothetical protein
LEWSFASADEIINTHKETNAGKKLSMAVMVNFPLIVARILPSATYVNDFRELLANTAIAASRVAAYPCIL